MEVREIEVNEELYNKFFTLVGNPDGTGAVSAAGNRRISQAKAAQALGVSAGMISSYKGKSYTGNIKELEDKMRSWIKREEGRVLNIYVPLASTSALQSMSKGLGIVQEERCIGVFAGEAGTGKTTTSEQYIEKANAGIHIKVDPSYSKSVLINSIARELGLETKGGLTVVIGRIVDALKGRDTIVIVDEADYLSDACLELLRRVINDKAQTGVALVGLPRLKYKLENLRNDHQQLTSRVGVFLEVKKLTRTDAVKILEGVWNDLAKETTDAFFKASWGSARTLVKLMGRVHQTMAINRMDAPDADVIEAAASMLMR